MELDLPVCTWFFQLFILNVWLGLCLHDVSCFAHCEVLLSYALLTFAADTSFDQSWIITRQLHYCCCNSVSPASWSSLSPLCSAQHRTFIAGLMSVQAYAMDHRCTFWNVLWLFKLCCCLWLSSSFRCPVCYESGFR